MVKPPSGTERRGYRLAVIWRGAIRETIAYRFKAPSIERSAREEVVALAGRRGWTTDELADRTVVTAGFDENGVQELSYGARAFRAWLLPDCAIELLDPDGKVPKTLPSARATDDAEEAKAAKRALSAAR